ncbi:uncharacterized protein LOC129583790 [Paramacrobiotus metropolitanus]|uniref:uncharacterized protein LOC129583790 n=1 Tax=Paramacrobiotus metropolitanus TaxID=2943436 RepID=UPI0024458AD2|nr:uncharacterized protein LOC129583790 [Paramacrobiotus metropolitanus]
MNGATDNSVDSDQEDLRMRSTKNKQGWVLPYLDPFCKEFVDLMRQLPSSSPVADLGCGYGYTSLKLLEAGCSVLANDLDNDQLQELQQSVPADLSGRLTVMPGNCVELSFSDSSFKGILAARWMHFLTSEEIIRSVLKRFYLWLEKGGVLCLTCNTLVHIATPEAYEKYVEKKSSGDEWPGWLDKSQNHIRKHLVDNIPDIFYGFDVESLSREVTLAGFDVVKCEMYGSTGVTKPWLEDNCIGILATKSR